MSLSFFSDQCVPAEIPDFLTRHGHQVTILRDVMPIRSLNGDFADIVAYPPANYAGIVAIQSHNHPEVIPSLMERLVAFLTTNASQSFYHGKLLIVEPHRIRIRE